MRTIDIRDAQAELSRLVDEAAEGKAFIIAKDGKPLVKVIAVDARDTSAHRRIGFLAGQFRVPDDFDRMGSSEVARSFGCDP